MDMKIDGKRIRLEREQRAWSQEHLAEVTGLGLRTIQRIEASRTGSYESVKAIAAAFATTVLSLRVTETAPEPQDSQRANESVSDAGTAEHQSDRRSRPAMLLQVVPAIVLASGVIVGSTIAAKMPSEYWWMVAFTLASSVVVSGVLGKLPNAPGRAGIANALLLAATCFIASAIVAHINFASLGLMVAILGGGSAVVLNRVQPCESRSTHRKQNS
ncbi:MAG TPA: helix-turn-helix transcriptional regulator [Steroidobacteraceae bacterium]|nr:helix-turn-helix transcriptional regulator [Steroidobacteraceae bacterium]